MNVANYATIIFDCDGVVFDSNAVKSGAFHQAALPYGREAASALVRYHKKHGGISRYQKFRHFLSEIASSELPGYGYPELLTAYAQCVENGMSSCQVAVGLDSLRQRTLGANWVVASGGDQAELRELFRRRKLSELFDGHIFGSPADKETIVRRCLATGVVKTPALFIGDSRYDFEVSTKFQDIDFLFLSGWSEMHDWRPWADANHIPFERCLADI